MKKLLTLGLLVLSLSACTSTQTTEYYTAVQNAAIAQSKMMQARYDACLLYTSPSPRDLSTSRMPSSA